MLWQASSMHWRRLNTAMSSAYWTVWNCPSVMSSIIWHCTAVGWDCKTPLCSGKGSERAPTSETTAEFWSNKARRMSIVCLTLHSIGLGEVSDRPASSLISSARWCGQLVVPGTSYLSTVCPSPMPSAVTPGVHTFVAGSPHSRHTRDSLGTTFKAYSRMRRLFSFPQLRIAHAKRFLSTSSLSSWTRQDLLWTGRVLSCRTGDEKSQFTK